MALGRRIEASRHLRAPTAVELGHQPRVIPACEDEPTACARGARGTCERAMWQFYKGQVRWCESRSRHPLNSKRVQNSGPFSHDACEPRERNGGKQPLGQERALLLTSRVATSERLEKPPVPAGHCKVGARHGLCGRITPRCYQVHPRLRPNVKYMAHFAFWAARRAAAATATARRSSRGSHQQVIASCEGEGLKPHERWRGVCENFSGPVELHRRLTCSDWKR